MNRISIIIIGLTILFNSCKTSYTSVLISDSYDKKTDKTNLTIVPFGNIELPGRWIKTDYNTVSRQHFFLRKSDSTYVAITKNPKTKYPFYIENQSDYEFVSNFYKWDSDYRENLGFDTEKLKENKIDNYIIWSVLLETGDNTFLYGLKQEFAYNFMIANDRMNSDKKIKFLEKLYYEN